MTEEQELYDKFVEVLNNRLDSDPSAQDMAVVLNFLKYNNIQASNRHKGVNKLNEKVKEMLPFDDELKEEQPLRRIK